MFLIFDICCLFTCKLAFVLNLLYCKDNQFIISLKMRQRFDNISALQCFCLDFYGLSAFSAALEPFFVTFGISQYTLIKNKIITFFNIYCSPLTQNWSFSGNILLSVSRPRGPTKKHAIRGGSYPPRIVRTKAFASAIFCFTLMAEGVRQRLFPLLRRFRDRT